MPKVSIIIPALNSIKYLRECVDSVVNQTLCDIEVIPVDAGSTDGTWEVFQEYASKDNRVIPICSDYKSHGYQCNLGIDTATGDYIGFVETDDYVERDMFEVLYNKAEECKTDWIISDFDRFVDVDGERIYYNHRIMSSSLYGKVLHPIQAIREPSWQHTNMWNGIYRREFLLKSNIRLNETPGAAFQDTGFISLTMIRAKRIQVIAKSFYRNRRDNPNSSIYNKRCMRFIADEFNYILKNFKPDEIQTAMVLPYLYRNVVNSFGSRLRACIDGKVCLPDVREHIEYFAGVLRKSISIRGIPVYSWALNSNDMSAYLFLYTYFLLNDTDEYYKQQYLVKKISEEKYKEGIAVFKSIPQLIIFGAGDWGQLYYIFLRRMRIKNVVCFCDNDKQKWGTELSGVPVCSIEDAMIRYPDAIYGVASSLHSDEIIGQLLRKQINACRIYNIGAFIPTVSDALGYFNNHGAASVYGDSTQ